VRLSDIKLAPGLTAARPDANVVFVTCKKVAQDISAKSTEEEQA
jgi:hypothetical protein